MIELTLIVLSIVIVMLIIVCLGLVGAQARQRRHLLNTRQSFLHFQEVFIRFLETHIESEVDRQEKWMLLKLRVAENQGRIADLAEWRVGAEARISKPVLVLSKEEVMATMSERVPVKPPPSESKPYTVDSNISKARFESLWSDPEDLLHYSGEDD